MKKPFKLFVFVLLFITSLYLSAQSNDVPEKGFIVGTCSIEQGLPTTNKISSTWYLTFRGETFIEKNVSIAGTVDYSLRKKEKYSDILVNHDVLFGVNYHFISNHLDTYIGFQPGISYSKTKILNTHFEDESLAVISPLMTATLGVRYYMGAIFHAFASATYVYGIQLSSKTNLSLSEFRLSAGVGINFNAFKRKGEN